MIGRGHETVVGRRIPSSRLDSSATGHTMKPPIKRLTDLKAKAPPPEPYARPSPRVSRQKTAKVLTDAERAAFLGFRPDLTSKS